MDQDPIEIKILNEEPAQVVEERNLKRDIGQKVAETAVSTGKKVWQSNARKKVTQTLGNGASKVAAKGSQVVQERVVKAAEEQAKAQLEATKERIRQTDWQAEAKKGVAATLRWLSLQLKQLSEKTEKRDRGPAIEDQNPNP
ncbi:MAG: hypothetical protein AAF490_14160 [Chloroflexota bacterium]